MRRTTSTRSGASSSRRPAESSGSRRRFPCRWRSSREGKSPRRDSWISSARAPRGSSDSRRRDPSGREPTPASRSWTRRGSGSSGNRTSGPNRGTAPSSDGRCEAGRSPSSAGDASRTPSSRGSTRMPERKAILALADGTLYRGTAFGHIGESGGEVVFNTGMTGYQEVITDPSYKGQMVTMTSPEIGNTGINPDDVESSRPWVEGFIVREGGRPPSDRRPRPREGSHVGQGNPLGDRRLGPRERIPPHLRVPDPVRENPEGGGDRLRNQAEHPEDARLPRHGGDAGPLGDHRLRDPFEATRRDLVVQRPRGSRRRPVRHPHRP